MSGSWKIFLKKSLLEDDAAAGKEMALVLNRTTTADTQTHTHRVNVYLGHGLFSFAVSCSHCDDGHSAAEESRETVQIR